MDSPLARVISALLGGYLIILLFLVVYDWVVEEYPRRPNKPASSERFQTPLFREKVVNILQQFSQLPKPEKDAIKENLGSSLISMEQWLIYLDQSDYQIMCIGELHEESTRNFLAEEFFAKFSNDVLLLEVTPKKLTRLIKRMETGREYFPLLDADIMKILRNTKDRNPDIEISGIEETDEQRKGQLDHSNSRDKSIAHNFWDRFQPGRRHVILIGALHCTEEPNWLFRHLCNQASPSLKKHMLNVRVLGEHQDGPLGIFVDFLDKIGIKKRHFVITDTNLLHPRIYDLFPLLNRQTLKKYRSLIVFRI